MGRNGAGKSTLLRLISGELAPDAGSVETGATVRVGHFSQEGRELDLNQRVHDFIHSIAGEVRTDEGTFSANQMMERFLFPGDLQSVPIGRLSGGERRRLYLLSILMAAPNVLLLDEPTNDLDVTTLSILEDYLQSFPGPVVAVSHDRFFLDKLAESIFEVRDGEVLRFTGNWSDWAGKRQAEETSGAAERSRPAAERPRDYGDPDAVLTAVESRSSCPLRILRDGEGQSAIRGLWPCGEGAGYAGGILSAAADGLRAAELTLAAL